MIAPLLLAACGRDFNLTVQTHPPVVDLDDALDFSQITSGEPFTVLGVVSDPDQEVEELDLFWSASGIGELVGEQTLTPRDEGAEVELVLDQGLAPGAYTISLLVTDPDAESAIDSISVYSNPDRPPTVSFATPDQGASFALGSSVSFVVSASDAEQPVTELTLTWSDLGYAVTPPPTNPTAAGLASFQTSEVLPIGQYVLSVVIRDRSGNEDSDAVLFSIVDGDRDGDGHIAVSLGGDDCDDQRPTVYDGADELCDLLDNDCDGSTDEDPVNGAEYYLDGDDDGFGDPDNALDSCVLPVGYSGEGTDCDDDDPDVFPGAPEWCNGVDDDCDDEIDEADAVDAAVWYADGDGDGHGVPGVTQIGCDQPTGFAPDDDDCHDGNAAVSPSAPELCGNNRDDDCDQLVDEPDAVDARDWYPDVDRDGVGDVSGAAHGCVSPSNYVSSTGDCDDLDADINPGAPERCNGVDDDCDGSIDEQGAIDGQVLYLDGDTDGFGNPAITARACASLAGHVELGTDCDDSDPSIRPGIPEICGNGVDDNCDGTSDGCRLEGTSDCWWGDVVLTAEGAGTLAGYSLASGDLDGDGEDDLVVGAPQAGATSTNKGAVYLLYGPISGNAGLATADRTVRGPSLFYKIGLAVAVAGDLDGDGDEELLAASDGGGTGGAVHLIRGGPLTGEMNASSASAIFSGAASGDVFGSGLAGRGDLDGDGWPDIVIGAQGDPTGGASAGSARIYLGGPAHPMSGAIPVSAAATRITGTAAARVGRAVVITTDLNADGRDELILGGPGADGLQSASGSVYLFWGRASYASGPTSVTDADVRIEGESTGDSFGGSVAWAGDVDADGWVDFLIGASAKTGAAGASQGAAYLFSSELFSGVIDTGDATARFWGAAASDVAGYPVVGGADLDDDGHPDFAIPAQKAQGLATRAGATTVRYGGVTYSGDLFPPSAGATLQGTATDDRFGYAAAFGDLNADGYSDLAVGAPYEDTAGLDAGAICIFNGGDL